MNFFKRVWQSFIRGPIWIILFGTVFFLIGGFMNYQQLDIRQNGLEVQGEVVRLTESCDDDGCTYRPSVTFTTQNGESITYTSKFSSNPPAYDVGEDVTIYYLPDNPQKARIKGEGGVIRFVFTAIGAGAFILGFFVFARNLKQRFMQAE